MAAKGEVHVDDPNYIPVDWIEKKFIRSGRYRGTITEAGAKVIIRYWYEHLTEQYRRREGHD